LRSIVEGRHKLILDVDSGQVELFDLMNDPGEEADLSSSLPTRTEELRRTLEHWRSENRHPDRSAPEMQLDEEERARLRALGYL
jgi:hypothetical protein